MNAFHPTQALLAIVASLAVLSAAPAQAADTNDLSDLARASGCLSCHAAKEKIVGPAYSAVAERYAGQKDAVAELMLSVQNGSVGKWGRIPMPAHGSLPASDIKQLVEWVLKTPR